MFLSTFLEGDEQTILSFLPVSFVLLGLTFLVPSLRASFRATHMLTCPGVYDEGPLMGRELKR